jgi:hypothetical protein
MQCRRGYSAGRSNGKQLQNKIKISSSSTRSVSLNHLTRLNTKADSHWNCPTTWATLAWFPWRASSPAARPCPRHNVIAFQDTKATQFLPRLWQDSVSPDPPQMP